MPRRLGLALTIVLVTLAAGCGGSSAIPRSDYDAAVVSTRDRVDAALAHITQATSKDDFLHRMVESAGLIDRAADDLGDTGSAEGVGTETKGAAPAPKQPPRA